MDLDTKLGPGFGLRFGLGFGPGFGPGFVINLAQDLVPDLVSFRDDQSPGFGFGFDKDYLVPDLVPFKVLSWYRFWIWFCP